MDSRPGAAHRAASGAAGESVRERESAHMYVRKALQSPASYMCEQDFSYFTSIRSKDRNHSDSVEDEIHVCFSQIRLRIEYSCSERQAPVSH